MASISSRVGLRSRVAAVVATEAARRAQSRDWVKPKMGPKMGMGPGRVVSSMRIASSESDGESVSGGLEESA